MPSTCYEIDPKQIIEALTAAVGTSVPDPNVWYCPCGCGAYLAYARAETGVWVVASQTFDASDTVWVHRLVHVDEIAELPRVYLQQHEKDAAFVALWLTQGLVEALMSAFELPPITVSREAMN